MVDMEKLFEEPEGYRQSQEDVPTLVTYERKHAPDDEPGDITVQLVGHKSPLWGHLLWNAGRVTAEWVDQNREYIRGKRVLEVGAAAALPSLLAAPVAANVVATDYPDPDLVENMRQNAERWQASVGRPLPITVEGYIWGNDVGPLLQATGQNGHKFDLILMSDLLFNHSEHTKLMDTCLKTLNPDGGQVLVVFSPHRPKLLNKDLAFFDMAKERGLKVEKILERRMQPMFEEDEETRELRSMVYGYMLHF